MADLVTDFCGMEVKNPIGVTSWDFGASERLLRRCAEKGIGWIIGKMVHKIDGPHRWPRPYFYSLKRLAMTSPTPIIPEFDANKRDQCGVCVRICPYGALSFDKGKDPVPTLNRAYCCGCGWCVGHCRPHAIRWVHVETGQVFWDGFGLIAD